MSINIIAELGCNMNGSMELAKKMIDVACVAGVDYVKFQKRTPDICVPEEQKNMMRKTPWGQITYLEYRKKLEFSNRQYVELDLYCQKKNVKWFASVWDLPSAEFLKNLIDIVKIPSAHLNNYDLLKYCRNNFKTVIMSTGMSTQEEIDEAVKIGNPDVIMSCNSQYPTPIDEENLNYITTLKNLYPNKEIGYSSHSYGLATSFASVALGANWIEKHITFDRTMFGSDQSSSVEPVGVIKLVKGVRDIERALGNGIKVITKGEQEKINSLKYLQNH